MTAKSSKMTSVVPLEIPVADFTAEKSLPLAANRSRGRWISAVSHRTGHEPERAVSP
jgi:hypothetical protein